MLESEIQDLTRLAFGRLSDATVLRNNVGTGWCGDVKTITKLSTVTLTPGTIVIKNPRPLHAGLSVGSGDLIGWRTITILPQHIGMKFAIFTSIEMKTPIGRARPDQKNWCKLVQEAGGIAGFARSPDDAIRIATSIDFGRSAN
jgi:hypothetical protein